MAYTYGTGTRFIGAQPQRWQDYAGGILADLPSMASTAMAVQNAVQGPSAIDYAPGMFQTALNRQLQGPSVAENAAARSAIGQQFNSAVGNIAGAAARGGFYSPGSVAQQAMRRPTASLANAYQQLEADRRKMLREGAAGVSNQLQGAMGTVLNREDANAKARGELIGTMQNKAASWRTAQQAQRPSWTMGWY